MTDAHPKGWIVLAQQAVARLTRATRPERQAVIIGLAAEAGLNVTSVRRALTAYKWIRSKAPLDGVAVDQVQAPVSSIEALVRISKLSPDDVGIYARSVLRGEMSYHSLLMLIRTLELAAREKAEDRIRTLDLAMLPSLIKEDLGWPADCAQVSELTPLARAVRADLEIAGPPGRGPRNAVAIVAPGWKPSTSRLTREEVCTALLAASLAFARVFYVPFDVAEWQAILGLMDATLVDAKRVKPLSLDKPATQATSPVRARPAVGAKKKKQPEHT